MCEIHNKGNKRELFLCQPLVRPLVDNKEWMSARKTGFYLLTYLQEAWPSFYSFFYPKNYNFITEP